MNIRYLIFASAIASVPLFPGTISAQDSAEPTLWGIYGAHNRHDCPVNNRETAKEVIAISLMDLGPLMKKYGVTSIELGVARWNDLKFVPERTFGDVITDVRALHGLENWEPSTEKR